MFQVAGTTIAARTDAAQLSASLAPHFSVDDSRPLVPEDYVTRLTELISSGRRGEAVGYYMTRALHVPLEGITQMRNAPFWR